MSIENITQTPLRRLVVTDPDEKYKCAKGHDSVIQSLAILPVNPATGTLHCCECRTDERVQLELRIPKEDRAPIVYGKETLQPPASDTGLSKEEIKLGQEARSKGQVQPIDEIKKELGFDSGDVETER
ncbi:hypothetical protein LCGC14_0347220 [marine sediment metagenome]|uniref:Uncharacterized protein n=1 Tax=marine sediment metagenome TaxID=412755 RepID=A0A0F9TBL3_9ZZZZ